MSEILDTVERIRVVHESDQNYKLELNNVSGDENYSGSKKSTEVFE